MAFLILLRTHNYAAKWKFMCMKRAGKNVGLPLGGAVSV